jgi:hypothetical protein
MSGMRAEAPYLLALAELLPCKKRPGELQVTMHVDVLAIECRWGQRPVVGVPVLLLTYVASQGNAIPPRTVAKQLS